MALVVDVPELIARLGIKADRKGKEWWARCPLPGHDEKTPSWQIRDDASDDERHGRWRCLGKCHDGGSPVGLVMRMLQLEPGEAFRWLRSTATNEQIALHVELTPAPPRGRPFRLPPGVLFGPLGEWVGTARDYLATDRGVTAAQAERWGIGYAIDGHLAGRIVLPWRTGFGRLVGYTGRTFTGSPKKYFEPGRDDGADRAAVYGEEHWPIPGRRGTIAVVEGAFDGFAIERSTGLHFGALAGSYLHPGHVARISTWERVLIVEDPDAAGKGLTDALHAALVRWVDVQRVQLPRGFDANKLERRRGSEALCAALGVELPAAGVAGSAG